jgi:aminotransferase
MFKFSERVKDLKQSGIRSASVRCAEIGGVNLGQGICDLPVPDSIIVETGKKMQEGKNIYSPCAGIMPLREKLAEKITEYNHIPTTAEEVMVGHGSTGVFTCATMSLLNPGDEVILFEPFYGYHKNVLDIIGVKVKAVAINLNDLSIDFEQLKSVCTERTKAIIICTPNNPTGKVFSKEELLQIGHIAKEKGLFVITDEIYEYITYPGYEHVSFASLEDFKDFTISMSGFSKTYNMTGWRLGYARSTPALIEKMSYAQDYLYVCPATPLQYGVLAALELPNNYYSDMKDLYLKKRDFMVDRLSCLGFDLCRPQGAYYIMADFKALGFTDDQAAADALLEKAKVATVTGRSFYLNPEDGKYSLRFCYALGQDKLEQAMNQLDAAFG